MEIDGRIQKIDFKLPAVSSVTASCNRHIFRNDLNQLIGYPQLNAHNIIINPDFTTAFIRPLDQRYSPQS